MFPFPDTAPWFVFLYIECCYRCSGIDYKYCSVGYIQQHEYDAFDAGDGAMAYNPSEEPEEEGCSGHHEQVEIAYRAEWQRAYHRRQAKHEKNMLNRQLPITFAYSQAGAPFVAATTEVASSGRDVPAATMVRPITASLTPMAGQATMRCQQRYHLPIRGAARPSTIMPQAFHIGTGTSNCEVFLPRLGLGMRWRGFCDGESIAHEYGEEEQQQDTVDACHHIGHISIEEMSVATCKQCHGGEHDKRYLVGHYTMFDLDGPHHGHDADNHQHIEDIAADHIAYGQSGTPFIADITLITSSGADVPNATMVRPITSSLIPKRLATPDPPSVSQLAPREYHRQSGDKQKDIE